MHLSKWKNEQKQGNENSYAVQNRQLTLELKPNLSNKNATELKGVGQVFTIVSILQALQMCVKIDQRI